MGRHDVAGSLATSSTNGGTSLTGRSCAGLGRRVIVSNTVVTVDVYGSLYAPRGQGRHLINVARVERRRRCRAAVSRRSAASPDVLCCRERPVAETIATVEEWDRS